MGASDTLLTVGILALGGGALYYLIQSGALKGLTEGLGQGVGFPQSEEREEAVEEGMGEIFDEVARDDDEDEPLARQALAEEEARDDAEDAAREANARKGTRVNQDEDKDTGGDEDEDEDEDEDQDEDTNGEGEGQGKDTDIEDEYDEGEVADDLSRDEVKKRIARNRARSITRRRTRKTSGVKRPKDIFEAVFPDYQKARQKYPTPPYQQQQYQQQQPQYPYQQYPQQTARPPAPGLVSSRYRYPTPPEQHVSLTKTTYSPYSPYNQFYQYYQYQQYPQGFLLPDDNVFFSDITRDGGRNYTDPRYPSSRSCIDCTSECAMNQYGYGCQVCRPQCKRAGTTPYKSGFQLGPAVPQGAFLATIWNTLTDGFRDMDEYKERKEKFDCHNRLLRRVPRERYNKKMVENSDYQYDRSDIKFAIQ